ncbi:VOC family protein [Mycobacterium sp. 050134]|uniref:VOC family protein n=1 Tax=Mycobacterium sp. 050134 TaxID=3096111 RepID=UPI002ED8CFA3
MALGLDMVTFDCHDPATLGGWWAAQFGGTAHELLAGEFTTVTLPDGVRLGFQKVPEPTPGKNRVHLDFGAADVDGEVARLVAAGAGETGRHTFGDKMRWVVLADPEGNVFCVVGR